MNRCRGPRVSVNPAARWARPRFAFQLPGPGATARHDVKFQEGCAGRGAQSRVQVLGLEGAGVEKGCHPARGEGAGCQVRGGREPPGRNRRRQRTLLGPLPLVFSPFPQPPQAGAAGGHPFGRAPARWAPWCRQLPGVSVSAHRACPRDSRIQTSCTVLPPPQGSSSSGPPTLPRIPSHCRARPARLGTFLGDIATASRPGRER